MTAIHTIQPKLLAEPTPGKKSMSLKNSNIRDLYYKDSYIYNTIYF